MQLPDTNFWIALTFDAHAHHRAANEWFQGRDTRLCHFCRVTQMSFLRLCTQPAVAGRQVMNLTEAWLAFDKILSDERVRIIDAEPAGLETLWRKHTQLPTPSHHVWTDAYLAAFAEAAGLELVTFDRGFKELKGPKLTILT